MNKTLRKYHRSIKTALALVLIVLGYVFNIKLLYVFAVIFLVMAIANFCPADYFEKKGKAKKK